MRLPRHAEIWLLPYFRDRLQRRNEPPPRRVWTAIADHYEPYWHNTDDTLARDRVLLWTKHWPEIARRHRDARGLPAQYTFFYPQEEYRPELIELLAGMAREGFGDVEVHIHHDCEGEAAWMEKMRSFLQALSGRHGLLRKDEAGRTLFGFIHGNWALDNSRPDGRYCGLNNELKLLDQLGCYADFTMPCGPLPCQARKLNRIYWAKDDPQRPKSYDQGEDLRPGGVRAGDLLMIPGPFALIRQPGRWRPSIEIGELGGNNPVTPGRVKAWLASAPRIGQDLFLKLFAHGTQERHSAPLLKSGLDQLFTLLGAECRAVGAELYFATAWQMYERIEALRLQQAPEPGGGLA
jgi:hypothetical protein